MNAQTRAVASVLFETDGTIPRNRIAAALDYLDGNTEQFAEMQMPRVISAKELAARANVSTRSLRRYARQGLLQTAHFATGKRGWGYTEESARAFLKRASAQAEQTHEQTDQEIEVVEN